MTRFSTLRPLCRDTSALGVGANGLRIAVRAMGPLMLALALTSAQAAEDFCDEDVCITVTERDNQVYFYAENHQTTDVTITINVKLENMTATERLPRTVTLGPRGFERVLRLLPKSSAKGRYQVESAWAFGSPDATHNPDADYRLPFKDGSCYPVTQAPFGNHSHAGKNAWDFKMPVGTPIVAARDGKVAAVRDSNTVSGIQEEFARYNNYVFIEHEDGTLGRYLHIKQGGAKVTPGERIAAGDVIALSGNIGRSAGPHLHFEVTRAADGYVTETFPVRFLVKGRGRISIGEEVVCAAKGRS